jgi:hypothetical protein
MHDMLLGTWGPQIVALCQQRPLQVLAIVLTVFSIVMTVILGVRGFGTDDPGGASFGDGDGGGCGD